MFTSLKNLKKVFLASCLLATVASLPLAAQQTTPWAPGFLTGNQSTLWGCSAVTAGNCTAWSPVTVSSGGSIITGGGVVTTGNQNMTSLSSAATPTIPAGTTQFYMTCTGAAISFTDDGVTTPTAAIGETVTVGSQLFYNATDLTKFKLIQQTASATCYFLYYK